MNVEIHALQCDSIIVLGFTDNVPIFGTIETLYKNESFDGTKLEHFVIKVRIIRFMLDDHIQAYEINIVRNISSFPYILFVHINLTLHL